MSICPHDPTEPITDEMRTELERRWPNGERLTWAWRLAKDIDTCAALIQGYPVDPSRVNQDELRKATKTTLVQLVAPIDLFT